LRREQEHQQLEDDQGSQEHQRQGEQVRRQGQDQPGRGEGPPPDNHVSLQIGPAGLRIGFELTKEQARPQKGQIQEDGVEPGLGSTIHGPVHLAGGHKPALEPLVSGCPPV